MLILRNVRSLGIAMEFNFLLDVDGVTVRVNSYTADDFLFDVLDVDGKILFDQRDASSHLTEQLEREFLRICENDRFENEE
jgi:hypothetical protein